MKELFCKHKNILIAIGTNLLLVLLAVFVFGSRYATDDDITMAAIAYGIFFEPQSRLVFSCTAWGTILKTLSLAVDGVNWQLILYYVVLFYGGTVSLLYVLKRKKILATVLWCLVVIGFYYSAYVEVNFSVITGMLAFYGYLTLFIGTYSKKKTPIILSIITLVFAMINRYESFFAFSFFAFIAFVLLVAREWSIEGLKSVFQRYFVPFFVALALPVILFIVDRVSYDNEAWKRYLDYNDNRSQILDFQSVLQHEDENYFQSLGLNEEMISSLENWQFNDTEIFGEELIIKMGNDSKEYNPKLTPEFVFEAIGYSVEKICKHYYFLFGVIVLIAFCLKKDSEGRNHLCVFWPPFMAMIPLIIELSYYLFMNRGIDRVFRTTALGFWCAIVSLYCCDYFVDRTYSENGYRNRTMIWMLAIFSVVSLWCQFEKLKDVQKFNIVDAQSVDEYYDFLRDGRIYMCDIGSIRDIENSYGIWQSPKKNSLYNCIELGGWMVNYPLVKDKQEVLGVPNPYKALAYNDNVYLLTTEDGKLQLDFLRSAYNEIIEKKLVEKHGNLSVYKYSVK